MLWAQAPAGRPSGDRCRTNGPHLSSAGFRGQGTPRQIATEAGARRQRFDSIGCWAFSLATEHHPLCKTGRPYDPPRRDSSFGGWPLAWFKSMAKFSWLNGATRCCWLGSKQHFPLHQTFCGELSSLLKVHPRSFGRLGHSSGRGWRHGRRRCRFFQKARPSAPGTGEFHSTGPSLPRHAAGLSPATPSIKNPSGTAGLWKAGAAGLDSPPARSHRRFQGGQLGERRALRWVTPGGSVPK